MTEKFGSFVSRTLRRPTLRFAIYFIDASLLTLQWILQREEEHYTIIVPCGIVVGRAFLVVQTPCRSCASRHPPALLIAVHEAQLAYSRMVSTGNRIG